MAKPTPPPVARLRSIALAPLRAARTGLSLAVGPQIAGVLAPLQQLRHPRSRCNSPSTASRCRARGGILRDLRVQAHGHGPGWCADGTDTLFIAGPVEPVRPGVAQFRVRELRLKGVDVPPRFIPPLVRTLRQQGEQRLRARRERTGASAGTKADLGNDIDLAGLADDGLPIPLPASVSDVRVVNGKLTLYRATPATGSASTKPAP